MNSPAEANAAKRGPVRFRRSDGRKLEPDEARRQGEITRIAFLLLGRDRAIEFLNSDNTELGGRPLDLAMGSVAGCASVEAALGRLVFHTAPGV